MDGNTAWNLVEAEDAPWIEDVIASVDADTITARQQERASRQRIKVMIADDDEFINNLAHRALARHCEIVQTYSGKDTLESYVRQMPNVIFLDIELGDASGLQLVKAILKLDPDAHIIMFSGHTYGETVRCSIEEGAKGFIAKPFPTNALLQHVMRYSKGVGLS
ncbi:MAG: hypothetical protein Alpg2KO_29900 [Alphaproteobacteria bacterium]